MNARTRSSYLIARLWELRALPLRSTHEPTGIEVWLLICLVLDAYERVENGRLG